MAACDQHEIDALTGEQFCCTLNERNVWVGSSEQVICFTWNVRAAAAGQRHRLSADDNDVVQRHYAREIIGVCAEIPIILADTSCQLKDMEKLDCLSDRHSTCTEWPQFFSCRQKPRLTFRQNVRRVYENKLLCCNSMQLLNIPCKLAQSYSW